MLVQAAQAEIGDQLQIGGGQHQQGLAAHFLKQAGAEPVLRLQLGLLLGFLLGVSIRVPDMQLDAGAAQRVGERLLLDDFL